MWPINRNIIEIYNNVSSQVLMSMSGAYAINEIAVLNRIKLDGIKRKDQKEILDLVVMFANKVISLRNEDNRRKQDIKNG